MAAAAPGPDAVTLAWIAAAAVIAGGLLSGAAALLGVRLGAKGEQERLQLTQENDRQQRREQIRRDSYAAFLTALDEFTWAAAAVHDQATSAGTGIRLTYVGPGEQPLGNALQENMRQLDKADSQVQLVGAATVAAIARDIVYHSANEVRPKAGSQSGEWDKNLQRSVELYKLFVAAARKDLNID